MNRPPLKRTIVRSSDTVTDKRTLGLWRLPRYAAQGERPTERDERPAERSGRRHAACMQAPAQSSGWEWVGPNLALDLAPMASRPISKAMGRPKSTFCLWLWWPDGHHGSAQSNLCICKYFKHHYAIDYAIIVTLQNRSSLLPHTAFTSLKVLNETERPIQTHRISGASRT